MIYVVLYLVAIIAANLSVAAFGPGASIINAFLFIGFDLVCRDKLHDTWARRNLWRNMAALIVAGSLLSWALNRDAGQIALASALAFGLSSAADAIIYALLGKRVRWVRVNGSNVMGAAVDSLVFPTVAFGGFMPLIVLGQFVAKIAGGALWYVVLRRKIAR